jgi:hypothetical protein
MSGAKKGAARFDPVPDDFASTMITIGCQGMDGAFKAIKVVGNAVVHDLHGFIVFVSANLAFVHNFPSLVTHPNLRSCGLFACGEET